MKDKRSRPARPENLANLAALDVLDVLIVGAGPVGLALAVDLARRGVSVRVIDLRETPTDESRAVIVHARTLEMLDALDVAEELIATGQKATGVEIHGDGKVLAHVAVDTVDSRFPFSVSTPQTETERILRERLSALGVEVDRGAKLISLTQDDDGVRAVLEYEHEGGLREVVASSWLVGADGGHSTVRSLVGERLEGEFKGERFLMGDVDARYELDHASFHMFFSPRFSPGMLFPMVGRRARVIVEIGDADRGRAASLEWLQQVADERGLNVELTSAHWLTTFETHHAQVPQYRVGRVFLAGDAAHVHSPAGGQGMNTGMQDAFNLGWKLALATRAGNELATSGALLDSYHAERHPVAAHVISLTTAMTRVGTARSRLEREVRNELMKLVSKIPAARARIVDELEEVAVGYRGSPIVVDGRHGPVQAGDAAPDVAELELAKQLTREGHTLMVVPGKDGAVPRIEYPIEADVVTVSMNGGGEISDPKRRIAARYGLEKEGGVVVVRPDGYIGVIAGLEDTAPIWTYAQRLGIARAPG
jgi:2-polyprenyl-6-methoxyphenol hydroxylase-like FAD-dependent oxidoreductase